MKLMQIKLTLEDKNDYSNKSKEEVEAALTELEQECINRIVQGILANRLIKYELEETAGHGFRATAALGVYDLDDPQLQNGGKPGAAKKTRLKS